MIRFTTIIKELAIEPDKSYIYINTLRTGLLICLNARSRGLIQSEVRFL